MKYKRISQGFGIYALFPADINLEELIKKSGPERDYYYSIYTYEKDHYNKFITGLEGVCKDHNVRFDLNDLFKTTKQLYARLKSLYPDKEEFKKVKDEVKSKFSIAGTTDIYIDKLVFDFDSKENVDKAKSETNQLCTRLIKDYNIPPDTLQVCFSGSKGFAVEVEIDQKLTRQEFVNIVSNLTKGLDTFDPSVKDEQRLFRIPFTKHNKTGLYKIPLTLGQLSDNSVEQIKEVAGNVDEYIEGLLETKNSWCSAKFNQQLKNLSALTVEQKKEMESNQTYTFDDRLQISRKPSWMSSTKFALQEGFFKPGERNNALMILAATYKSHGYPKEIAYYMLKGVAELQHKRTGQEKYSKDEIWNNIIDVVYSTSWQGGTYSEKETELLKNTAERFNLTIEQERNLVGIEDVRSRFIYFAENIDQNTIKTGIDSIDNNVLITTGMTVGILGAPSSGKTSFANNFVKNLSANGQNVLFHSLDMSDNLLYGRLLQRYCQYDLKTILHKIKLNQLDEKIITAFEMAQEEYKNVKFNFRSGTNVDNIEQDIIEYKEKVGENLKLVVVDYLEKVRGPYSDATANSGYIASRLSDLAREHDLCLLMLLQPQKSAGDPREELLSMRKVKGASVIEQDCRVIMTMWRPGFNPKDMSDDKFASVAVVKNNMGGLCKLDYRWNGVEGSLTEMGSDDKIMYNDLMERLKTEKEAEKKGGNFYDL
jgi:replicative DNA helicase